VLALAACGPHVDVRAERSRIATFPRYSTYTWGSPAAPARSSGETEASLLDWRIRNAVERALAAKGYERTDGAATLLVDYDVSTRERNTDSFREYFQYRRTGATQGMGESFVRGYGEGTLVLHLVDARTRELAYRASATGVIDESADRSRLEKAITRMMADLPQSTGTRDGR
jgi:hypothetical protein